MNIVITIPEASEFDKSLIPSCIQENTTIVKKDGFDGSAILLFIQQLFDILGNAAAIAGFIYVLHKDYKAKVTISGEPVPPKATEKDIKDMIEQQNKTIEALKDEINNLKKTDTANNAEEQ